MGRRMIAVLLIGSLLLLPGCRKQCSHEWADATCTSPKICTLCGETEGEALGHQWKAATCTEPITCILCHETEGAPLGHRWEEATCTEPRTCQVCHETQGTPLGHRWEEATCTQPKTCVVCQETEGSPLGHDWAPATCTTPKICRTCGLTEGTALGHQWMAATTARPKTCSVCGATEGTKLSSSLPEVLVSRRDLETMADILYYTNEYRRQFGIAELTENTELDILAHLRAEEASINWSHTRPDGSNFDSIFTEYGITYRVKGENLASATYRKTGEEVVEQWIASPSHEENLRREVYTKIGIGCCQGSDGWWYWCQLFAAN